MLVLEKSPGVSERETGLGGRDASFDEPESAVDIICRVDGRISRKS